MVDLAELGVELGDEAPVIGRSAAAACEAGSRRPKIHFLKLRDDVLARLDQLLPQGRFVAVGHSRSFKRESDFVHRNLAAAWIRAGIALDVQPFCRNVPVMRAD
jgi:hypothetical protein